MNVRSNTCRGFSHQEREWMCFIPASSPHFESTITTSGLAWGEGMCLITKLFSLSFFFPLSQLVRVWPWPWTEQRYASWKIWIFIYLEYHLENKCLSMIYMLKYICYLTYYVIRRWFKGNKIRKCVRKQMPFHSSTLPSMNLVFDIHVVS